MHKKRSCLGRCASCYPTVLPVTHRSGLRVLEHFFNRLHQLLGKVLHNREVVDNLATPAVGYWSVVSVWWQAAKLVSEAQPTRQKGKQEQAPPHTMRAGVGMTAAP